MQLPSCGDNGEVVSGSNRDAWVGLWNFAWLSVNVTKNLANFFLFVSFKVTDELFLLSRHVGLHCGFSSLCSARRIVEIWDLRCVQSFGSDVVCEDSFWRRHQSVLIRVKEDSCWVIVDRVSRCDGPHSWFTFFSPGCFDCAHPVHVTRLEYSLTKKE